MEEKQLYRPILKKAWQITRKFKSLWFLGLFAAIFSGGGEFEILSRIIFNPVNDQGAIKEFMASFKSGINDSLQAGGDLGVAFHFGQNIRQAVLGEQKIEQRSVILLVGQFNQLGNLFFVFRNFFLIFQQARLRLGHPLVDILNLEIRGLDLEVKRRLLFFELVDLVLQGIFLPLDLV